MSERIPIGQCVKGRVYKLRSRNLAFGVYDGEGGFIGIRTKFNDRYLFTELHWDCIIGTVRNQVDTGVDVPSDIEVKEDLGTIDRKTGRPVAYDMGNEWFFTDTGEYSEDIHAATKHNKSLFRFLEKVERDA